MTTRESRPDGGGRRSDNASKSLETKIPSQDARNHLARSVLGGLLHSDVTDARRAVAGIVLESFDDPILRTIFAAIEDVVTMGLAPTPESVYDILVADGTDPDEINALCIAVAELWGEAPPGERRGSHRASLATRTRIGSASLFGGAP